MSVLIKGMEMPKNCYRCLFFRMTTLWNKVGEADTLFRCVRTREESWEYRGGYLPNCPLIPVPEHGDLIDRNKLYEKTAEWEAQALHMVEVHMNDEDASEWRKWSTVLTERSAFKFDVADAPTIIPAEEEEG